MADIENLQNQPRETVLEMDGQFSVAEIRNLGFLGLVDDTLPFRPIPKKLLETVSAEYARTQDPRAVIHTLLAAYTIYRDSVNRNGFTAPFVYSDGAYEWPEPTIANWDHPDGIQFLGTALGAFNVQQGASVHVFQQSGEQFYDAARDIQSGGITEKEIQQILAATDQVIPYHVPKIKDLAMLQNQAWQNLALRIFASGLLRCYEDMATETEVNQEEIHSFITNLIALKEVAISLPAIRFARPGEHLKHINNLFITDF